MNAGCIAMIDALGFKGIWKRAHPEELLEQMKLVREAIADTTRKATRHFATFAGPGRLTRAPTMSSVFLSDTIVISAQVAELENQTSEMQRNIESALVAFVVHATAFALAGSSNNENRVPLNYRGAITWGAFTIDDTFLVGPAVDEAASLYETADAAIVELTEGAAQRFMHATAPPFPQQMLPRTLTLEHGLRRKNGLVESRRVVNPFGVCTDTHQIHAVLDGMKKAFGPERHGALARKFENTMQLVEAGRAAWHLVHHPA